MNDITKQLAEIEVTDFTQKDLELIAKFEEDGRVGLATVTDVDAHRMMQLYLDGKNYRDISILLKRDKATILYLSKKLDWPAMRKEFLQNLVNTMQDKIIEAKIQQQSFLLHLSLAYQKKIGRNVDDFLRTDNAANFNMFDSKDISSYLKIVETLHKMNSANFGKELEKAPLVGIGGMSEGMTIKKTGENTIEITPKPITAMSAKLKDLANLKRGLDKSQEVPVESHDISKQEQTNTEEGTDNE